MFIFITAVLVSIIFERQERRHRFEESLEYLRMGKEMPKPEPKVPFLESWMGVVVGCYVFALGVGMVWSNFMVMRLVQNVGNNYNTGRVFTEGGAMIAAGIAIIILGIKSVRQHRRVKYKT